MTFAELSDNQRRVFRWWNDRDLDALICDGSVRSGKTAAMSCSFILWAMKNFSGASFGICGNTVQAVERNIVAPLMQMIDITYYFRIKYTSSGKHMLMISGGGRENYFYIFGGKDEASYKLIQGITLAGVLFDEVVLMPESFVNQAIARTLSVDAAKLWFSCNPDSPNHWFYTEWIKKAEEKKPAKEKKAVAVDSALLAKTDKVLRANLANPNYKAENKVKDVNDMLELLKQASPEQKKGLFFTEDKLNQALKDIK